MLTTSQSPTLKLQCVNYRPKAKPMFAHGFPASAILQFPTAQLLRCSCPSPHVVATCCCYHHKNPTVLSLQPQLQASYKTVFTCIAFWSRSHLSTTLIATPCLLRTVSRCWLSLNFKMNSFGRGWLLYITWMMSRMHVVRNASAPLSLASMIAGSSLCTRDPARQPTEDSNDVAGTPFTGCGSGARTEPA